MVYVLFMFNLSFSFFVCVKQVAEILGMSSECLSFKYCSGPSPDSSEATMNREVHKLIHNLVLHIHKYEPDMEKSILIFLPTYYALEQQWLDLICVSSTFEIHILHSSIDTEQALNAMRISKSHRKVCLFTFHVCVLTGVCFWVLELIILFCWLKVTNYIFSLFG